MRGAGLRAVILLLSIGAGFYLALLVVLFFAQTGMLFPGAAGPAPMLPSTGERLSLAVGNGDQLRGVHIRADPVGDGGEPVVLGFGGNAWNADAVAATLHELYPHSDAVVFHYRGYPPSSGSASAAALLEDAPLILDDVARRFADKRIVVVGFSVGTAPAARLATDKRIAGAILVTPFDSLRNLAASHFPWAPVGLLLRHRLDPIDDVRGAEVPIAIIAAAQDEIVPRRSTEALAAAVGRLVLDEVIADSSHNSIYQRPAFHAAMREALARMN